MIRFGGIERGFGNDMGWEGGSMEEEGKSQKCFCAIYPRAYYVRLEADGMEYLIRACYFEHCLFLSSSF